MRMMLPQLFVPEKADTTREERFRKKIESVENDDEARTRKLSRRCKAMKGDEISALRKVSRQEYLKKREKKKVEELRDDIEDERFLFDGGKLSEEEQSELRYKKKMYDLVKKRSEDIGDNNEYRMPEAYDQEGGVNQEKRFSVARYKEYSSSSDKMKNRFAEQEAWEEHQIRKAPFKFGGSKGEKEQKSDEYQFVLEDQIEFIKASVMDSDKFEDGFDFDSTPKSASSEKQQLKDDYYRLSIHTEMNCSKQ